MISYCVPVRKPGNGLGGGMFQNNSSILSFNLQLLLNQVKPNFLELPQWGFSGMINVKGITTITIIIIVN